MKSPGEIIIQGSLRMYARYISTPCIVATRCEIFSAYVSKSRGMHSFREKNVVYMFEGHRLAHKVI